MILLHVPNPEDSPTGKSPVRLRYAIEREPVRPVLRYGHGTRTLSRADWLRLEQLGATIEATSPRERAIVAEVLGATR